MSIKVNNISKYYNHQCALNNVSFNIASNEIVGFLGPNGAGKSTLMKIITGYIPQSSGNVSVCNKEVQENSLNIRKEIGYLPEHNPLYQDMYVKEYLQFVAGMYKLSNIKSKVKEMIDITGLKKEQHKKIATLSKGYRQRVGLAQAIISDPKVLILDEPTTGLDPNQIIEVRELIKNLGKEKTILLSTHIMQEVQAICNRVIIINKGNIVADNKTNIITETNYNNSQIIHVEFNQTIDPNQLLNTLNILSVEKTKPTEYKIITKNDIDIRSDIFHFAVNNNLEILMMTKNERSLEDVFRELTGQ
ncbi:MAG: gliding motility-associated ABC transporter ATP-binding subunit GldA [Marinilabiliaceae bacterium]|nr:gliding motility-associated ABC transporter ATP-binding subunit GldA [Marinilabiliaceae bacterium]